MATFIEEKKKQRGLVYIVTATFFIVVFILWYNFWRRPALPTPAEEVVSTAFVGVISIDFSVLEDSTLQELQPFEGVSPFEGELGRENPFAPF